MKNKINWTGTLRISPIKKGVIKVGKWMVVARQVRPKWADEVPAYRGNNYIEKRGRITAVVEEGNKVVVDAEFKRPKGKRIDKRFLMKQILANVNFHKQSMKKLLSKMFYYNFTKEELQRIQKEGVMFHRPRKLDWWDSQKIFLKCSGKYYEI
jgi:hypothetical protein